MPIALLIMQLLPMLFDLIKRAPETVDAVKDVVKTLQEIPPDSPDSIARIAGALEALPLDVQAECLACVKAETHG